MTFKSLICLRHFFLNNFDFQLMPPSAIELMEMENWSEHILPLPLSAGNSRFPTLWVLPGLLLRCYALPPRVHLWGKDLVEGSLNVENALEFEPQPYENKQANQYISKCDSQLSLNSVPNIMWHACHPVIYGTVASQGDAFRLYDSDSLVALGIFFFYSCVYLTLLYLRGTFFLKFPQSLFLSVPAGPYIGRAKALDSCPYKDTAMTCL